MLERLARLVPERGPSHHPVLGVRGNPAKFSLSPRGVSASVPNNGIWGCSGSGPGHVRRKDAESGHPRPGHGKLRPLLCPAASRFRLKSALFSVFESFWEEAETGILTVGPLLDMDFLAAM